MQLSLQRGQTIPFWTVGLLILLAIMFFIASYANTIAWQIRAQSAADSAASSGLSVQANVFNEESTILYAAAVDETRIRYLNQAILNTIQGIGCTGTVCDQNYSSLKSELNYALAGYSSDIHLLGQADQLSEGGQQQDEAKAIKAFGSGCGTSGGGFDCAFTYSIIAQQDVGSGKKNQTSPTEVDLVACKNVAFFVPELMGLTSGASFQALGRAAAAVVPAVIETFRPGVAVNPATGQVYQPPEPQWAAALQSPWYTVDYSALSVQVNWYAAGAIEPFANKAAKPGNGSGQYQCS